jgi:hypothetical protein
MNRFRALATAVTVVLAISVTLAAQGKGQRPGGPKATTQPKAGARTVQGGGHPKGAAIASGTSTKTTGSGRGAAPKPVKTSASTSTSTSGSTTTTDAAATPATPATTTAPAPAAPNALSAKISQNPNQLARVKAMLPADMTIEAATTGFRNQGQFIAALNASKNQGIAFTDLQKAMTENGLSLGQAVKQMKNAPPAPEPAPVPAPTPAPAS